MKKENDNKWAIILGGSSGLGLATAKKLARHQFNLILIHRDRKSDLEGITNTFQEITSSGVQLISYNKDATNKQEQAAILEGVSDVLNGQKIDLLVHSIAKGNLKPMIRRGDAGPVLKNDDFSLTINAMATSFYDWTQALASQNLFAPKARTVAYTSEGSHKPWANYAAVSAAKAALEAIMRNMALEFAPLEITANCIQAGVTDTKSFRMIPGHEKLREAALRRNPNKRLTRPEDVANALYLLTLPEADWINGIVLKVDGGESLQ